jgi:large repetitive protein
MLGVSQRPARVLAAFLLVPWLLALGATAADAQAPACGAVLSEDTVLEADLLDCPGNGLVIGADGITVDLNGHTISGQIISGENLSQVGIDNSAGHDDVTIRNGSVEYFARGAVHLAGADRNQVLDLDTLLSREFAILVEGGSDNRLAGNSVRTPGAVGIAIFGTAQVSRGNVIADNVVESANTANIALRYGRITGTLIENNRVSEGQAQEQWGAGIAVSARYAGVEGDIRATVVRGNRARDDFGGGLFVGQSAADTVVEDNQVDNAYGLPAIESAGTRTVIRGNAIRSSAFPGSTSFGIQLDEEAVDSRVELNTVDRAGGVSIDDSGTRSRISANAIQGQVSSSGLITGVIAGIIIREEAGGGRVQANVIRRQSPGYERGAGIAVLGDAITLIANVVDQIESADAIRVEAEATGTTLVANVATRSDDDGIEVDNPATTLTANVADHNADHGIEAVAGVIDRGGNRAHDNGNPIQCVGVVCA